MRKVVTLAAFCSVAAVTLVQAAAPPPKPPANASMYVGDAELQSIMQKSPSAFSTRLWADKTYSTSFIRLDKPDQAHAHGTWSEVFVVKQGSGILETGGAITGRDRGGSAGDGGNFTGEAGKGPTPAKTVTKKPAAAARAART